MSLLADFGDFIKTPEGQGLLSGVFGYAANAQRGTPINNLGRGGLAGLLGYSNAQERQTQQAENELQQKYRNMQMTEMQRKLDEQKGQQEWRAGLPSVLDSKVAVDTDFGPSFGPNTSAINQYLLDPRSPFADKVLEQRLFPKAADYKEVGNSLLQIGQGGVKEVWTAPPENKPTAQMQNYEYAVKNGYKGSFSDFVSLGPTITAGAVAGLRAAQVASMQANDDYRLPPPPKPASSGPVTVTVNGQSYQFPNQSAANSFKMKAGIK